MSTDTLLNRAGICRVPDAYTPSETATLNAAVDAKLSERATERRSYVHVDELHDAGMLDLVLGQRMRDILLSIMPDPVLYHCFVIETAGNDPEPNLFGERLAGWHRDVDCAFTVTEPTHVSIFVYLSDVGENDGAFAFVPQNPERWLRTSSPAIAVTGATGTTFAWQRSYFHRASPNRGPRRRRLVKISIQRNRYPSAHLANAHFQRTLGAVAAGDAVLDLLLGRYQGRPAPVLPRPFVAATPIAPTAALGLSDADLTKARVRGVAAAAKARLKALVKPAVASAAYD